MHRSELVGAARAALSVSAGRTIVTAMIALAEGKALIIDLRENAAGGVAGDRAGTYI